MRIEVVTFSETEALRKLRTALWRRKGRMVQLVLGDVVSARLPVRSQVTLTGQAEVRDQEVPMIPVVLHLSVLHRSTSLQW
jgi:hypothetical protein